MAAFIHCIWHEGEPPRQHDYRASWREQNPQAEIYLWSFAELESVMHERFPAVVDRYRLMPHLIQKANVLRVVAVLAFGGIYLDLDTQALAPFGDYFERELVFGYKVDPRREGKRQSLGIIGNSLMGAREPGHPFFASMLDWQMRLKPDIEHPMEAIRTTGAGLLTDLIHAHRLAAHVAPHEVFFGLARDPVERAITRHRAGFRWNKPLTTTT